ncbi:hypothetical protein Tco_1395682, partial [Tanacetum coccineum]
GGTRCGCQVGDDDDGRRLTAMVSVEEAEWWRKWQQVGEGHDGVATVKAVVVRG